MMDEVDTGLLDSLFEKTLRKVSVKAFEAIIACGIRGPKDLLGLSEERFRTSDGYSAQVADQLLEARDNLRADLEQWSLHVEAVAKNEAVGQQLTTAQSASCDQTNSAIEQTARAIPAAMLAALTTRAWNLLARENIFAISDLLALTEDRIRSFQGAESQTVSQILSLKLALTSKSSWFGENAPLVDVPTALSGEKQPSNSASRPPRPKSNKLPPSHHAPCHISEWSKPPPSHHAPCHISEWSVLRLTLSDLFVESADAPIHILRYWESVNVSDLGHSPKDLRLLRAVAIFPEDDLSYVFPFSIEYLIRLGISDDALSKILHFLAKACLVADAKSLSLRLESLCTSPILDGLDLTSISSMRVEAEGTNATSIEFLPQGRLTTWLDVAAVSERSLVQALGLSPRTLRTIHETWQIRDQAVALLRIQEDWLPESAYKTYESLIRQTTASMIRGEKERVVAVERLALLRDSKPSLEEVSQLLGITRERVRQIEKRSFADFESVCSRKLGRLRHAVRVALDDSGGVLLAAELANMLATRWSWANEPAPSSIAQLVMISTPFQVVPGPPSLVVMPQHRCVDCGLPNPELTRVVETEGGMLPLADAVRVLRDYCNSEMTCPHPRAKFSTGFLQYHIQRGNDLVLDDAAVFSKSAWVIAKGNRTDAIRAILLKAGRAMHWSEVKSELEKRRPHDQGLSRNYLLSTMGRLDCLVMWGRGTYIHRQHVDYLKEVIRQIADDITRRLAQPIPYLSVSGVFRVHRESLVASRIPNEVALYSCLRASASSLLYLPEYPYIMRKDSHDDRLPLGLVLEKYVRERDGTVNGHELRDFAVNTLLVNEKLMPVFLANIPGVLRLGGDQFIHASLLGIQAQQLIPITEHLENLLTTSDHVSVQRLFSDKRVMCKMLGISTAEHLYSLLQMFFSQRYGLAHYPSILREDTRIEGRKGWGVARKVVSYLRDKQAPCSTAELYRHFVDELGYIQRSVTSAQFQPEVVRYTEGTLIHIETIGWNQEKQTALESSALRHLSEREAAGKAYGLAQILYEYGEISPLAKNIPWTKTLVAELLCLEGRFRLLGTQRNAFVSIPNRRSIETLSDLLRIMLTDEYDGAANLSSFTQEMVAAGILQRTLTQSMLGEDSRVVISGPLVKTTEAM